jgi:stage III sporulation protein AE
MKKFLIKTALIITLALILMRPAYAVGGDEVLQRQSDALGISGLESSLGGDAGELLGGLSVTDALSVDRGLTRLLSGIGGRLGEIFLSGLRDAALIVLIAVFCSIVTSSFGAEKADYVVLAGVLAIAAVSVTSVNSFIGLGRQVLDELNVFSRMLLPTLAGAAASAGAITSAAAKYAATVLFMDVMITISKGIIMPLILAYIAVSIAEAATGGSSLAGASGLIKWLAKTILSIIVIAFVAYLGITGVITGTSDAVAIRAAKVTMQTVLPVIGSIIADASETVLAGASILRNAVGIFGMLAVLAICIIPFLRLGASYLLFKAAGGVAGAIADKRIGKLIDAVGTAFGLTMGVVGVAAMMLYISIISVIRVVV